MRLTLGIMGLLSLAGCDDRPKEWTAFVYRDQADLSQSLKLVGFNSFERCQEAAITTLRTYDDPDAGDYECGYMCRYEPAMETHVCKETRK